MGMQSPRVSPAVAAAATTTTASHARPTAAPSLAPAGPPAPSSTTVASAAAGPRAKCDQVVYEAIAKAAEIVVRGRCRLNDDHDGGSGSGGTGAEGNVGAERTGGMMHRHYSRHSHSAATAAAAALVGNRPRLGTVAATTFSPGAGVGTGAATATTTTTTTTTTTSGRFNIEVPEVEAVRATLQRWKRSLHVPLRLDIYYQYDEVDEDDAAAAENERKLHRTTTRRELLERWCIDYVASSDVGGGGGGGIGGGAMSVPHRGAGGAGTSNDDTIAQLRMVCKRVVILLRTLHCLARIMPAYRLHRGLLAAEALTATAAAAIEPVGGRVGYGVMGGYYPSTGGPGMSRPTTATTTTGLGVAEAAVGGSIGYSFYVSGSEGIASEAALFGTNSPFARQELTSVPTPFGILHLTGLYDASLNVQRAMQMRAHRLRRLRGNGAGGGFDRPSSGAIPIRSCGGGGPLDYGGAYAVRGEEDEAADGGPWHPHLPAPQVMHFTPPGHCHLVLPEERQQHEARLRAGISHGDFTKGGEGRPSPVDGRAYLAQRPFVQRANSCLTGKEAEERRMEMNQRRGGLEKHPEEGGGKMSGLSLALMESEEAGAAEREHARRQFQRDDDKTRLGSPASPYRAEAVCTNDATAMQQRMRAALHLPPPIMHQQQVSSLPRGAGYVLPGRNTSEYGYGYNGGHTVHASPATISPATPVLSDVGGAPGSGAGPGPLVSASPSPMNLVTTPPFLPSPAIGQRSPGGFSLRASPGSVKSTRTPTGSRPCLPAPPFSPNPLTLGPAPVADSNVASTLSHQRKGYDTGSGGNAGSARYLSARVEAGAGEVPSHPLPPFSSLDILQASPFKTAIVALQSGGNRGGSLLSSLSGTAASAAHYGGYNDDFQFGGPSFAVGGGSVGVGHTSSLALHRSAPGSELSLRGSAWDGGGGGQPILGEQPGSSFEDMPFAVDIGPAGIGDTGAGAGASVPVDGTNAGVVSHLGLSEVSSQAITSLAHRCATAGRLKLFSSVHHNRHSGGDEMADEEGAGALAGGASLNFHGGQSASTDVSALADQLAEFHTFGATLKTGGGGSSQAATLGSMNPAARGTKPSSMVGAT